MIVVMVIVLWMTNGEVGYRVQYVPPSLICELEAPRFKDVMENQPGISNVKVVCVHPGEAI